MTCTHIYNFYTQTYISAYTHTNISLNLRTVIFTYKQIYTFIYTFNIIYMNMHEFIHKIFIPSFLSIIHSDIKITFLNTCKQKFVLAKIETYIHVYEKNKDMLSTSYCTFGIVLSLKTASDCSLSYCRPFKNLSFSYPTRLNKMKSTKYQFWVHFHSAKSISNHFKTLKKFWIFFLKKSEKWNQQKILFECSFIAQNSFQTILGLWKTLKNFRKEIWNFCVSTPILHRWKKWSQQKIIFGCSVIVQNPVQTILGLRTILEFSQKFEIFVFSTPHTA